MVRRATLCAGVSASLVCLLPSAWSRETPISGKKRLPEKSKKLKIENFLFRLALTLLVRLGAGRGKVQRHLFLATI